MGKKRTFDVGNPKAQVEDIKKQQSKYSLGETGYSFHNIKQFKPVFAFDYVSVNGEDLCFNSNKLVADDLRGLIIGLKKISSFSYEELNKNPAFRFHVINFDDPKVQVSRAEFKKVLTNRPDKLADEHLPTFYQIDIQYVQEARICGFLYKGVFYLVWYDRNHQIYKRK